MKKEVNQSKEFAITIILVVLGVALLSWVGEKQQISGTAGYSVRGVRDDAQYGETRGFTPEHNHAWERLGNRISKRYGNTNTEINTNAGDSISSSGRIIYVGVNGFFVQVDNRVVYVPTTESMNVGNYVLFTYTLLPSGEISVLSVEKQ